MKNSIVSTKTPSADTRDMAPFVALSSATMDAVMIDELTEHLNALKRDDCYRVDTVLKQSAFETTERVFFVGVNGAELGPFVRKRIDRDSGTGSAYECIFSAQRAGCRFRYLPRIIDCYEADGQSVVVMEYVGGETLHDVVYRCDPSVALARDVFPSLCDAVSELHEDFDTPLIHRDLKPSNIMLSKNNMTIIDFGIARSYKEDSDDDTRHFGTRAYAPPEQFGFGQTDVRSDVYALGMILYFCLTERVPDAKARRKEFRDTGFPEAFRRVIVRATAFDPADRYATVSELKEAFLVAAGMTATRCVSPSVSQSRNVSSVVAAAREVTPCQKEVSSGWTAAKRSVPANILGRIPFAVGAAWDILLVMVLMLFLIGAIGSAIDPSAGSFEEEKSLAFRLLTYGCLLFFIVGPVLFAVSDRRPLARFIPMLRGSSIGRSLVVCSILPFVGVVVFGMLSQFS